MENQQQQSAATTALCRAGCGFFGSSSTDGLCSKCFKDSIKKKQDTGRASPPSSITSSDNAKFVAVMREAVAANTQQGNDLKAQLEAAVASAQANVAVDSPSLSSSSSSASLAIETASMLSETVEPSTSMPDSSSSKNKPNRCMVCKKRLGLTGFPCRCGNNYCSEHRFETDHGCTFDYKNAGREEIRKNNPVVVSEKIQRI